jgi:integrase
VRQTYTVLRAILDTAVRDGLAARNPVAAVKRPKVSATDAAYLIPEQVRAVLSAAKATRYVLLVSIGMRRG